MVKPGTGSNRKTRLVVLRHSLDEAAARAIIDSKKTDVFKKRLKRPRREEVRIHSVRFFYEAVLLVSARYRADYFRKATHPIRVDYNVSEVVLGDGVFPIIPKSKLTRAFLGRRGKNRVELELEEHVFVESEDSMYFDCHGDEMEFRHSIDPKTIEHYPKRMLRNCEPDLKRPGITVGAALERLGKKMQRPAESDVRDLTDELAVTDTAEIYLPVFEARLVGPGKKIGIMRIDAVRKKVL